MSLRGRIRPLLPALLLLWSCAPAEREPERTEPPPEPAETAGPAISAEDFESGETEAWREAETGAEKPETP